MLNKFTKLKFAKIQKTMIKNNNNKLNEKSYIDEV